MKQTRLKENNNKNSNEKTMVYSLSGLTESPPPLRCRILLLNNGESEELAEGTRKVVHLRRLWLS